MSKILRGWWWSFLEFSYTDFLTCAMRAERWEMHSVSLQSEVCFPSSSASPWNKNWENPVAIFFYFYFFFLPLPFVASSDEHVTPPQTVREALLPKTLPRSTRRGIRETLADVYWWHVDTLSLLFHSVEDCSSFSAVILSLAKQKKHRRKVPCVLPGFNSSFLANSLL